MKTDALADQALGWLKELIKIDSSNPPGNEAPVIAFVQKTLAGFGIQSEIFEKTPGRPNLIASLQSTGKDGILLCSHADTVPAFNENNSWSKPPFGAVEADGYLWGRGTVDMKYKIALDLALMSVLAKEKCKVPVSMVVTSDEEAGGVHGAQFIAPNLKEKLKARYVINEGGGFNIWVAGRPVFVLQIGEKGHVQIKIEIPGEAGHASMPPVNNCIYQLADFLQKIKIHAEKQYLLIPATENLINNLILAIKDKNPPAAQLLQALLNVDSAAPALEILQQHETTLATQLRAMLYSTIVPTIIKSGNLGNMTAASAVLTLDCRVLPGVSSKDFIADITSLLPAGAKLTVLQAGEGFSFAENDPLVQHCLKGLQADAGANGIVSNYLLPASSDSRHYASVGLITLGFAPVFFEAGFPGINLAHAVDERLPVSGFKQGLSTYIKTLTSFVL